MSILGSSPPVPEEKKGGEDLCSPDMMIQSLGFNRKLAKINLIYTLILGCHYIYIDKCITAQIEDRKDSLNNKDVFQPIRYNWWSNYLTAIGQTVGEL